MFSSPLKTLAEYRELRESFRLAAPERFNFGDDVVDRWANESPEKLAMIWTAGDGARTDISFGLLAARSNQVANALAGLGLQRGDQVLIDLPSIAPWWESVVGLTKAGMIAIPGTTLLTEKDIAYRVKAAEVDAIITDLQGAEKVDHIAGELAGLK